MATSGLKTVAEDVLTAAANIPFDWTQVRDAEKSRPTVLFQSVHMWNDQINREKSGSGYSFEKPACFLQLMQMGNEMFASGVNCANYIFRFHIVDMRLNADGETSQDNTGKYIPTLDDNLDVITFRDAAKQALAGYQPPQCSTLFPVDENQDEAHDDVYHYTLDLKALFTDTKGSYLDPDQTTVEYVAPPTDGEINIGFGDAPAGTDPLTIEIEPTL